MTSVEDSLQKLKVLLLTPEEQAFLLGVKICIDGTPKSPRMQQSRLQNSCFYEYQIFNTFSFIIRPKSFFCLFLIVNNNFFLLLMVYSSSLSL